MSTKERWPPWVYSTGEEPDYRFSLANERTFLAWIRTALAFIACGVAVDTLDLDMSPSAQAVLAFVAVLLGFLSAAVAWWRWARTEVALRHQQPLPGTPTLAVIAITLTMTTVMILALAL